MAIITISRESFSRGEEVTAKVVQRLAYKMVSHEVISEASRKFQVSANKLERAIPCRKTSGNYIYVLPSGSQSASW
jgi:hypothetical protein